MTIHNNLFGWAGDKFSLWDNCWLWTGGGVLICEKTAWYRVTGVGGGCGGHGSLSVPQHGAVGGNGARIFRELIEIPAGIYKISIGSGGPGGTGDVNGTPGGDTVIGSLLTLGGGQPSGVGSLSGYFSSALSGKIQSSVQGFNSLSHLFDIGMNAPIICSGNQGIAAVTQTVDGDGYSGIGYGIGGSGSYNPTVGGVARTGGAGTPGILFIELATDK